MELPKTKTILIVDDEEDFCFFVKQNLQQLGPYRVLIATDGASGLKMAGQLHPDVILLDILMPRMGGLEVLKKLKANPDTMEIPVLMLTAKNDAESKQQAAQGYDEDYLVKPVQADFLKMKIERALSRIGR